MKYELIYVKDVLVAKLPYGYPTIMFMNLLNDDSDLCKNIEELLNVDYFNLSDITVEIEK